MHGQLVMGAALGEMEIGDLDVPPPARAVRHVGGEDEEDDRSQHQDADDRDQEERRWLGRLS